MARTAAALLAVCAAGALAGCAGAPVQDTPVQDASAGVIRVDRSAGQRDMLPVPALPSGGPGATVTLDGLWAGASESDDPSTVRCSVDAASGTREYVYFSHGMGRAPTDETVGVVINHHERAGGTAEVGFVVVFTDSSGAPVQMSAPSADSVRVLLAEDKRSLAFSMITGPADQRGEGTPTTAVGTLSCPSS